MRKTVKINNLALHGFTLAELLASLVILGVISTFTIPKVINAQQNNQWNSTAKEAFSMISGAYQAYRLDNTPTAGTRTVHLTPYMNYVRVDSSSSTMDHVTGRTNVTCGAFDPCLVLHNGGKIKIQSNNSFGDTANNRFLYFIFDPDGTYSGSTTGVGKGIVIDIFYNGRITDSANRPAGSQTLVGATTHTWAPDPEADWFEW